ncbi:citron Rho-interacting kinase [Fopius arisanus]|uniref:CIT protein n=1 Tax=Fopius arisanus TaxID=64838 RepID=A0A0C9RT21_9HYME|nr:PREDICTED: citron Rho-interacting kinase-like [Fopius arisanus]
MLALPKTPTKMGKETLELSVSVRNKRKERPETSKKLLELPDKPHPSSSLVHLSNDKLELAIQLECKMKEIQQQQRRMLELQDKISTNTRLTLSREKSELAEKLERNMEELEEHQKKLLELNDKNAYDSQLTTNLELQLEEQTVKVEASNRERDKLERQLTSMKSDVASLQRTLQLERQERKDLEETALGLIRSAKQKWEAAEKDKLSRLNKHIETQTTRITELCTSNNEMSSKLQRAQCDLETANAELQKLRSFQAQYKQSLAKTRELRRQSVQGVENKLEEISVRAHNQLAEVRLKLEQEVAKNTELESTLRNERDANHCKLSRLNMALELAQSELKDLQEQLRSTQAMIPARDQEIATLKNQLKEKLNQMEGIHVAEQTISQLTEQLEKVQMENEQMKNQLESTRSDLNDTLLNLRRSENIADDLEKTAQDKAALQQRLQESRAKEDEQLRKVDTLEELLQCLQQSVAKLESENAVLKRSSSSIPSGSRVSTTKENSLKLSELEQQIERLEKQLETSRESAVAEREAARQTQRALWKKEKELSDANLDKRIALREAKTSEEKIKSLQEEKQRLTERLNKKYQEEEEKAKKLLSELESAKTSLAEITRESSRNKMQADSAQRALTQANKQIEELQSSSAGLRRELDAARKQARTSQDRVDSLNAENKRLTFAISKHNEVKSTLEAKLEELEQEAKADKVNIDLLKETCTVLEEQLTDYERLTSDHETRENTLVQEKMKLQKELEVLEQKLREAKSGQNEEKSKRLISEKAMQKLESETSEIETERDNLLTQRNEYKKLAQDLNQQVASLTSKCGQLECDIGELQRALESARAEAMIVKEESTDHLTRLHELKDINQDLMADLQSSIDQGQELRIRIAELESVLEEMRQFYNEHEMKSEGTRQQQTKLIDYLQLKLEECNKKKKTVCDRIFRTKQKDSVIPTGTGMPVGYRELENQLTRERAKVKALTEQLLVLKAAAVTSAPVSPTVDCKSAESKPQDSKKYQYSEQPDELLSRQTSLQRVRHNIPHRFNVELSMRAGKCAACLEPIQFGKRSAICSECQIMTHLKCSLLVPANCGLPGGLTRHLGKNWKASDESISTLSGSVQTLTIDEPDHAELESKNVKKKDGGAMESWVKVPGRGKASWERKYVRLEDSCLHVYEHEPSPGMSPINRMELTDKNGFTVIEDVHQAEVPGTAKSDIPFIFRVESNTFNTCWPTNRLDIMALSQVDKKSWLNALKSVASQNGVRGTAKNSMVQSVVRLEKNRLDLNCVIELEEEGVLLIGAEEGLYSYRPAVSKVLTAIRGVKRVHQLTVHPHLGLALMIAGEDRQLVSCDLRQLKSNALAADCSRPAINTKRILNGSESCHLYQLEEDLLCAATASQVILLKWKTDQVDGKFVPVRELETQEPCSCAIFTKDNLIVGCQKFFQIDLQNYGVDDFPEEDDSSVKAALAGVARLGIFPVAVLNVSNGSQVELLLCYNEFGVFVNENGRRTRMVDPTWSHLPFAFAFRKPYLFIVHFSSVEVIKLTLETFRSTNKSPERALIDLNNPRYLGLAGSRGIYVAVINSTLDIQRIDGVASILSRISDSLSSLDSLCNNDNDESSSEFSFTPSLMEALDNPAKKVHFADTRDN